MTRPDDMRGSWAEEVRTGTRDVLGRSSRIALTATGLFVLWAVLCPLDSAVVAEGVVVPSGHNQVLQHRTGGRILAIDGRDGERVAAGDPVFRLDPVNDEAELTRLTARLALLDAVRRRLEAENALAAAPAPASSARFAAFALRPAFDARPEGEPSQPVPASLTADGGGDALAAEQQRELERGRGAAGAEIEAMTARRQAMERRRAGTAERLTAVEARAASLERQLDELRPVVERGFVARRVLRETENALLERRAEIADLRAEAAALADEAAEMDSRIRQTRLADQRQTSARLTEVIGESEQIAGQIRAAEAAVRMSEVRAPVAGTLVHSRHSTLGAVVAPGEVLAEIVPSGGDLAFKARVPTTGITHVRVGQRGRVKISSLNARSFDDVPAVVTRVAADATLDERSGQRFFEVELRLEPVQPGERELLGPGMMGQAFVEGESRTFARYALAPILESLDRAFQEH